MPKPITEAENQFLELTAMRLAFQLQYIEIIERIIDTKSTETSRDEDLRSFIDLLKQETIRQWNVTDKYIRHRKRKTPAPIFEPPKETRFNSVLDALEWIFKELSQMKEKNNF